MTTQVKKLTCQQPGPVGCADDFPYVPGSFRGAGKALERHLTVSVNSGNYGIEVMCDTTGKRSQPRAGSRVTPGGFLTVVSLKVIFPNAHPIRLSVYSKSRLNVFLRSLRAGFFAAR